MKNNLFSIVIPCYKDAIYLIDALRSCICQKKITFNYEIIIVDDGTPDDSCEKVFRQYFAYSFVKFFKKENGGLSSARNFGASVATGSHIIFLDSDDRISDTYLADASSQIASLQKYNILVMPHKYFITDKEFQRKLWLKNFSHLPILVFGGRINRILLRSGNCFPVSACVIPRNTLEESIVFNEDLKSLEDWDLWLRLQSKGVKFTYSIKNGHTLIRIRDGMMSNVARMLYYEKIVANKHGIRLILWSRKLHSVDLAIRILRFISYILGNLKNIAAKAINFNMPHN